MSFKSFSGSSTAQTSGNSKENRKVLTAKALMTLNDSSFDRSSSKKRPKSLSLSTAYHIRKLLHQNFDRLTLTSSTGAALKADALSDLDTLLQTLYSDQEVSVTVQQLERLTSFHQNLSNQGARYRQELRKTEQEIFWLLGFKLQEVTHNGTILIVDDTEMNLRLLSTGLTNHGYEVCGVNNSNSVLMAAIDTKPDLILLDIMMPGIDGYEVCARLKANAPTRDIPVIFISMMNDALDKVKAFGVGGVDYISKPFQLEEVLARVDHQLNLRNLQKRLEEQNVRLHQEIQERKKAEMRYRSIFENAIDGIFQSTLEGRYLNANPALARIYGYASPEEMITTVHNIAEQLYVYPQRRQEFVSYIEQQGVVIDFESQVFQKDGTIIWVSETVRKIAGLDGVPFYEGTVRDITARKLGQRS